MYNVGYTFNILFPVIVIYQPEVEIIGMNFN